MFKIIYGTKDSESLSIQNVETGETKAFQRSINIYDEMGEPILNELGEFQTKVNSNFISEVEDFAGKGFLDG